MASNKPGRRSPIDAGLDTLGIFAIAFNDGKKTKEQLKVGLLSIVNYGIFAHITPPYQRMREAQSKIAPAVDSAVPPSEREKMYYIDGIGTDPACQGHGFGSMLLQSITEQVGATIQITSLAVNIYHTKPGF